MRYVLILAIVLGALLAAKLFFGAVIGGIFAALKLSFILLLALGVVGFVGARLLKR